MRERNGKAPSGDEGRLLVIGGHETRNGNGLILRALSQIVGRGKVVVATMASEEPEKMWTEYARAFRSLGVPHRHHLRIESRQDAENPRVLSTLAGANCVFFTGGDQLRITSYLGDSLTYRTIAELFRNGAILAGTSAGASAFSTTMMVRGEPNESQKIHEGLELAPGLGFVRDVIIDQHFGERGRIGRLLGVLAQNPRILGIGIDENTAIDMRPGKWFQVIGEGGVTVTCGSRVTHVDATERGRTISLFDARVHVLSQGDRFNLREREPESRAASEIERLIESGEGLAGPRTVRSRRGVGSRDGSSSRRYQRANGSR